MTATLDLDKTRSYRAKSTSKISHPEEKSYPRVQVPFKLSVDYFDAEKNDRIRTLSKTVELKCLSPAEEIRHN